MLKVFLENTIRDAVTYTEHAKRKTCTAADVIYALKRQGHILYGFHGGAIAPSKTPKPHSTKPAGGGKKKPEKRSRSRSRSGSAQSSTIQKRYAKLTGDEIKAAIGEDFCSRKEIYDAENIKNYQDGIYGPVPGHVKIIKYYRGNPNPDTFIGFAMYRPFDKDIHLKMKYQTPKPNQRIKITAKKDKRRSSKDS